MRSVRGVIGAVQEGRFRLIAEDGRVLPFVLSHTAKIEPQDLPALVQAARVRVEYSDSPGLLAGIAHRLHVEE